MVETRKGEEVTQNAASEVAELEDKYNLSEKEKLREELASLRNIPINSSTVVEISPMEQGSALAAFVGRYDVLMAEQFEDMRFRLR